MTTLRCAAVLFNFGRCGVGDGGVKVIVRAFHTLLCGCVRASESRRWMEGGGSNKVLTSVLRVSLRRIYSLRSAVYTHIVHEMNIICDNPRWRIRAEDPTHSHARLSQPSKLRRVLWHTPTHNYYCYYHRAVIVNIGCVECSRVCVCSHSTSLAACVRACVGDQLGRELFVAKCRAKVLPSMRHECFNGRKIA